VSVSNFLYLSGLCLPLCGQADRQQSGFSVENVDIVSVPASLSPTIERPSMDVNDSTSPPAPQTPSLVNEVPVVKPSPITSSPSPTSRAIDRIDPDMKVPTEKLKRISNASSSGSTRLSNLLQEHSPDVSTPTGPLSAPLQPPEIHEDSRSLHRDIPGSCAPPDRVSSTSSGSVHNADNLAESSSTGNLLDAAVSDSEHALQISEDGTIEAGTLEGLVDHFLKETHDRAKDDDVRRAFLATYRLFTIDKTLFNTLKRRFEMMGVSDASNPFVPPDPIRLRCVLCTYSDVRSLTHRSSTLLFLQTWLQCDGENMGYELLTSIKQFAKTVAGSDSDIINPMVQEIVNLVGEKLALRVMTILPVGQIAFSLGQIKAVDIAISLSVIEGDCYSKITQADYVAHIRGAPITKHIEFAIELNNRLSSWVKTKILK
jgi:son of sevenless